MDAPEHGERRALDELAVLADELLEQARASRQRWAELSAALGDPAAAGAAAAAAADAIAAPPDTNGAAPAHAHEPVTTVDGWPVTQPGAPAAPPHEDRRRRRRRATEPAPPAEDADPIRLVTLDMLLSGHTREEVDGYLSATFGDAYDPAVVDEVFDSAEPSPADD